jgi:hypothetical protein
MYAETLLAIMACGVWGQKSLKNGQFSQRCGVPHPEGTMADRSKPLPRANSAIRQSSRTKFNENRAKCDISVTGPVQSLLVARANVGACKFWAQSPENGQFSLSFGMPTPRGRCQIAVLSPIWGKNCDLAEFPSKQKKEIEQKM